MPAAPPALSRPRGRPTLDEITAERAKRSLREYVRQAWHVLEPATPFVPGWHIDAISDHCEAVVRRDIKRLLVTVPPGAMKSLTVSVFFPTWSWIDPYFGRDAERPARPLRGPHLRFLTVSHGQALATRDSVKSRMLMDHEWYQTRWGGHFRLTSDQNEKMRYVNDKTGYRVAGSVGGATGERGDILLLDDAHQIEQAESDTIRQGVVDWYDTTFSTRLSDAEIGCIVVVGQRVHEADTIGHLLDRGGFERLILPMEYERTPYVRASGFTHDPVTHTTATGFRDPRTRDGELLHPARFGPAAVAEQKLKGSYKYSALFQQRPSPAEGGRIKRAWFRYWHRAGTNPGPVMVRTAEGIIGVPSMELPATFDEQLASYDMTFKDKKAARSADIDYVAGSVWGRLGADKFMLDLVRERLDFPDTVKAVRAMSAKWPDAYAKLIEDTANGPAIIATLKHEIPGLIAIPAKGGKPARTAAASPQIESGNVYLPHPAQCPWTEIVIFESTVFPNGDHDDTLDSMTQALLRFAGGAGIQVFALDISGSKAVPVDQFPAPLNKEQRFLMGLPPEGPEPRPDDRPATCLDCGHPVSEHTGEDGRCAHDEGCRCRAAVTDPAKAMSPEQRFELGLE